MHNRFRIHCRLRKTRSPVQLRLGQASRGGRAAVQLWHWQTALNINTQIHRFAHCTAHIKRSIISIAAWIWAWQTTMTSPHWSMFWCWAWLCSILFLSFQSGTYWSCSITPIPPVWPTFDRLKFECTCDCGAHERAWVIFRKDEKKNQQTKKNKKTIERVVGTLEQRAGW